jgi:hypothetical protein
LAGGCSLACLLCLFSTAAGAVPRLVPGLQQWQDTPGHWQLDATRHIVLGPQADTRERALAQRLSQELAGVSGLAPPAIVAAAQRRPGDIELRTHDCVVPVPLPWQRQEAYRLRIDDSVLLCAPTW